MGGIAASALWAAGHPLLPCLTMGRLHGIDMGQIMTCTSLCPQIGPQSSCFSPHPKYPPSPSRVPLSCRTHRAEGRAGGTSLLPGYLRHAEDPIRLHLGPTRQPTRSGADKQLRSPKSPWVPQPPSSQQKKHHRSTGLGPPHLTIPIWPPSLSPRL